jgi:D-amino peptidase
MYKRFLFALDLEGVNNVVGNPYAGLSSADDYEVAKNQAALEINAAAEALFEIGAEKVDLWDNHGGGGNLKQEQLDSRVRLLSVEKAAPRMDFAEGEYDCICFFGYHTMEGTLGGVLAHTMNSKAHQYYKINGKYIGEVDIDSAIAAEHSMPSIFFVGGDLTCKQAEASVPHIVTVVTKKELSRNEAIFRNNDELFADIKEKICVAATKEATYNRLSFPFVFEKSFKRTEDAKWHFEKYRDLSLDVDYLTDNIMGKDAHTLVININTLDEFLKVI